MPVSSLRAFIREAECIGCTKCIDACPVDAILGSNKHLHTVITNECIGCKLCIAPCPVDCIDMLPQTDASSQSKTYTIHRYHARKMRQKNIISQSPPAIIDKKKYIQEMLLRTKIKKNK